MIKNLNPLRWFRDNEDIKGDFRPRITHMEKTDQPDPEQEIQPDLAPPVEQARKSPAPD